MRFTTHSMLWTSACLSFLLAGGCAADDGTAPEISDLTATPTTMTVGQQVTVTGTLHFDDPEGDLDQLGAEITIPDGTKQALRNVDLSTVGTVTTGTLTWALIVVPPAAGTYTLALWVTDANGNDSNRLETTATAM